MDHGIDFSHFYSGYYLGLWFPLLRTRQHDICLRIHHPELPARIVHFYHVMRDEQKSAQRLGQAIRH
jgi:hypothetical protein